MMAARSAEGSCRAWTMLPIRDLAEASSSSSCCAGLDRIAVSGEQTHICPQVQLLKLVQERPCLFIRLDLHPGSATRTPERNFPRLTTNFFVNPCCLPRGVISGNSIPCRHFKHLNTTSGSSNSAKPNPACLFPAPVILLSLCSGPHVCRGEALAELVNAGDGGTYLYETDQDGIRNPIRNPPDIHLGRLDRRFHEVRILHPWHPHHHMRRPRQPGTMRIKPIRPPAHPLRREPQAGGRTARVPLWRRTHHHHRVTESHGRSRALSDGGRVVRYRDHAVCVW